MARISSVGALDGDTIDIHLPDGSAVLFCLSPHLDDPRFAMLKEDDRILYPKTDGEHIYWRDGPKLTLEEVFTLIKAGEAQMGHE